MELHLLINGQKCEVKFERHHTFDRVLGLLKENNLIPSNLPVDRIEIMGIDNQRYTKNSFVYQCMASNRYEVKLKFSHTSSQLTNMKESVMEGPGLRKARMVDIVKGFFQKMQKRQFRRLQKYQNHDDEIISLVAKFTKSYERLYAMHVFYKEKCAKLSQEERRQLQDYKKRFQQDFQRADRQNQYKLEQPIKNDSVYQQQVSMIQSQVRESIQVENQSKVQDLQRQLHKLQRSMQQQILDEKNNTKILNDIIEQSKKTELKLRMLIKQLQKTTAVRSEQFSALKQELAALKQKLENKKYDILSQQREIEFQKERNKVLQQEMRNLQELLERKSQQLREMAQNSQQINKQHDSLTKKQQIQNQQLAAAKNKLQNQLLVFSNQFAALKNQKNQLQQENNQLRTQNPRNSKLSFLKIRSMKSHESFEETTYLPLPKLNQCFQKQLAERFCQRIQPYLKKKLKMLSNLLYHPSDLKLSAKKIIKQIKGKQNLLLVCLTKQKKVVGGFTSIAIDGYCSSEQKSKCKAFLFNIEQESVNLFQIKDDRRPVTYDQDFFILGDEELSIDYETLLLSSRFVNKRSLSNLSFEDIHSQRKSFLSASQSQQVELISYWLFQCTLQ